MAGAEIVDRHRIALEPEPRQYVHGRDLVGHGVGFGDLDAEPAGRDPVNLAQEIEMVCELQVPEIGHRYVDSNR